MTGNTIQPLGGLRILDFSRVLAGPYCTALLADIGADVLKIEPPTGDDYRHIGPFYPDGSSCLFEAVNRGKRSAVIDLATEQGKKLAAALAAEADVVVENFRPGVALRLGIGWDALSAVNARLVYVSISGFGQDGPNATRPAYDPIIQAVAGLMSATGRADGPPTLIGESVADITSGLFASWAILAALLERTRTGRGRYIDLAMFDALVALQPTVVARTLATGLPPKRTGNRHPASAPFGIYAAADGDVAIACLNSKLFETLCSVMGKPDLPRDPRFTTDAARVDNGTELADEIEAWSGALSVTEVVRMLSAAGVPAGEVNDIAQTLASRQATVRPPLQTLVDGVDTIRSAPRQPARFMGLPEQSSRRAPNLGAEIDPLQTWTAQRLRTP